MKLALIFCLFVVAVSARRTYHGDQVLRITLSREDQAQTLEDLTEVFELDFWKPIRSVKAPVDVRVPAKHVVPFKVALTRFRLDFEIFIEDVQELIDNERTSHPVARDLGSFQYEVYHTFDEIQQWIDDMANAYSPLATKTEVGKSFEGRTFSALTISTGPGRPQFVINCGIHAREWVTPATCMYSAMLLVNNLDADIAALMNEVDFVFIPSSNPDGYVYTHTNDRMWRKTRSTTPGFCVGVDPNRNFDANHCGAGSSTSPCSDTYCGPSPFSEPCTAAQRDFVESLPNVQMYVDVHSYSQLWMYPYGYTTTPAVNADVMDKIAQDSVAAIRSVHGKIYEAGSIASTIYVASGSTADYFYDKSGIKCTFATELRDTGRYGFLLPENQIRPTAEESFAAFIVMARAVSEGTCA